MELKIFIHSCLVILCLSGKKKRSNLISWRIEKQKTIRYNNHIILK